MALSQDLINKFAKVVNEDKKQTKAPSLLYGYAKRDGKGNYTVKLDGSDYEPLPADIASIASGVYIPETADNDKGTRVLVMISNHSASIIASLEGSENTVTTLDGAVQGALKVGTLETEVLNVKYMLNGHAAKFQVLEADNLKINNTLEGVIADIKYINTNMLTANDIRAEFATITNLEATNLVVDTLSAQFGVFKETTTERLEADKAVIDSLDSTYADIDFINITDAAIEKIFGSTGVIKNITIAEGSVTGELNGVTINGDLINANTLKADRLVIKGTDGLYYQLNAGVNGVTENELATEEYQSKLHGSNIIAKTITADQIKVTDLTAFGATIGGFHITDTSLYSGVKESIANTTNGIFLDSDGQMYIGDSESYIKYHKDDTGTYVFDICTDAISFGEDYLYLAKNSRDAVIDLCNGLARLSHTVDSKGYSQFTIDTTYALSSMKISAPRSKVLFIENASTTNGVMITARSKVKNSSGVYELTSVGGFGMTRDGYMVRCGSDVDEDNPETYTVLDTGNFPDAVDSGWIYGGVLGENFTLYDNDYQIQYRKIGKIVQIRGQVRPTTAIPGSADNHTIFTLPAGYRPSETVNVRCQGSGSYSWLLSITSGGLVRFARYNDGTQYVDTSTTSWLPFHATFFVD